MSPSPANDLFNREDFYKVLVGILEPQETLLLSTHLLEETAPFLSRALLLRQGTLVPTWTPWRWRKRVPTSSPM